MCFYEWSVPQIEEKQRRDCIFNKLNILYKDNLWVFENMTIWKVKKVWVGKYFNHKILALKETLTKIALIISQFQFEKFIE